MVPGMFIVGVWAVFPALLKNPNGGVATFVSLFPLTSPLVMFFRTSIAEPPAWQIGLSILILILSTVGMAWIAGTNLPGRNPDVRQEAHDPRDPAVGPLQAGRDSPAGASLAAPVGR